MSTDITVRKVQGTYVVRAGGAVVAETNAALELSEGDLKPVIYFPRDDVAMALLEPSATRTTCPHKGEATHYSIQLKSMLIEDSAWEYENPAADVADIKDHVAFYSRKVAVEQL
ncbi:DUF427 domain-containing protein [Aliiroseovarius sp. PTFE2010]|uniref:DUF427 domain-containing protein n=1 Tax=Aliiroseovarius sp. PTFE2010 TaxID=3417190 RepID=UPI003CF55244